MGAEHLFAAARDALVWFAALRLHWFVKLATIDAAAATAKGPGSASESATIAARFADVVQPVGPIPPGKTTGRAADDDDDSNIEASGGMEHLFAVCCVAAFPRPDYALLYGGDGDTDDDDYDGGALDGALEFV
jgi:hypothetical protein